MIIFEASAIFETVVKIDTWLKQKASLTKLSLSKWVAGIVRRLILS